MCVARWPVKNNRTTAIKDWSVVLNVGDSKIQILWDATYVQNGSEITVDAIESTAVIEPKDSVVFGFCGVTTGPLYGAAVVSVSAVE